MSSSTVPSRTASRSKTDKKLEKKYMDLAVQEAQEGVTRGEGGPFGAVIVGKEGEVIARAHNMVLQTNDPTAHAEVTCIRKASAKLGRFDLSDCKIYSTCEPCPMCFGAIHWAKLPVCVFGATAKDAADAGFDDAFIYNAIRKTTSEEKVVMQQQQHQGAIEVMKLDYDLY